MVRPQRHSERSARATVTPPGAGPRGLDEAVLVGARRVATALTEPTRRGRDEWLAVVGDCQALINTLTAVQDTAIAEAARRESIWCEDGTLGETVHGPGRVSLDAADLVAPLVGASHAQAQRRVEQAVRLAIGRVPVPADDRDVPEASGLKGLHEVMAAGHLDGYRAGVVAFELEVAPPEVADAIVAALSGHLADDAAGLRRRTRVLLHRISPDLVRERAKRARAATGLRRWVAEPGVDEWHGTFPSEDAAAAWAAIDRLAHDLVAAGTCTDIEQARGKALTDLVTGNATIDVQVVLTVPADTGTAHTGAVSSFAGSSSSASQHRGPTPGARGRASATTMAGRRDATVVDHAQPTTSELDPRCGHGLEDCRVQLPGSRVLPASDDDLVEVHGARPSEPLLVRRGWLRDHLSKAPPKPRRGSKRARPQFVPCDPLTGARLDPGDQRATDAYHPGDELAALVRARDGRCRFPGCSIAARFCDLDHVRPWPLGRTAAANLLTLCRRHHRIKQRPGWRLRLAPDGTATWSDPTGRERTTAPVDALQSLVLRVDPADDHLRGTPTTTLTTLSTGGRGAGSPTDRDPAEVRSWSALETLLVLRLEHHPGARPLHDPAHPTHRRCTSAADLSTGFAHRRVRAAIADLPPF